LYGEACELIAHCLLQVYYYYYYCYYYYQYTQHNDIYNNYNLYLRSTYGEACDIVASVIRGSCYSSRGGSRNIVRAV